MGRILAVDYGQKRIGLAVTDPLQIIANGLETRSASSIHDWLRDYLKSGEIEKVILGYPRQMNNQPSESVKYIEPFIRWFEKQFPGICLELFDERFTSRMAERSLIEGGVKKSKRRNKELIDKTAAVLILQSYLEYSRNKV